MRQFKHLDLGDGRKRKGNSKKKKTVRVWEGVPVKKVGLLISLI